MATLSIFFIVLITAFAVVAFFTEPSTTDKQVHSRLVAVERKRTPSSRDDEADILRDVTLSTIPTLDAFMRNNRLVTGLCLLIDQCGLQWTVGRVVFATLVSVCVGALIGNWWIAPGLIGWVP